MTEEPVEEVAATFMHTLKLNDIYAFDKERYAGSLGPGYKYSTYRRDRGGLSTVHTLLVKVNDNKVAIFTSSSWNEELAASQLDQIVTAAESNS